MRPVAFNGCAGWLHPGRSDHGVVICGAVGYEASGTHRGLHDLALKLSCLGYEVLRFDYFGTGDSIGSGAETGLFELWQDSIRDAVNFLRAERRITSVTLIGYRLGGLLACLVARGTAACGQVVLLDPIISGRHHARELRLLGSAWNVAHAQPAALETTLVVVGETYDTDFVAALGAVDLRKVGLNRSRLLLISDDRVGLQAFEQACRDEGSDVTRRTFPEGPSFLLEPVLAVVPHDAFAAVLSWLGAPASMRPGIPWTATARLELSGVQERPLLFGDRPQLFGVLCTPDQRQSLRLPTIVFVNTGVTRHTGDGRLFVEAARALANHGVSSFRLDLAGVGESEVDPARSGVIYEMAACNDVRAALDALQSLGHQRFVILGICSGAHTAFHVARSEARITALVMVNLQTFTWTPGQSVKVQRRRAKRPAQYYFAALLSRRAWVRLFRTDLAVGSICLAIISRPFLHAKRLAAGAAERWLGMQSSSGSIRRWLAELDARQTDVRFCFGRDDQGIAEFTKWFGAKAKSLRPLKRVQVRLLDGVDHAMQAKRSRDVLTALLVEEIGAGLGRQP